MKKYVIITGGELFNKGAQAMTFTTVCEIAKRCPEAIPVVFSVRDYKRPQTEKENFCMEFLPMPGFGESMSLTTGLLRNKYRAGKNGRNYELYLEILQNAVAWIDISGYALGSNWGEQLALVYVRRIYLAKSFGIPMYLMPQSFGPFDFVGKKAFLVNAVLKRYLPYCRYIMAREYEGKKLLENKYKLKNVIATSDLVLQSEEPDLSLIYKQPPISRRINVSPGSVAIIPNMKNMKYGKPEEMNALYRTIIDRLLSIGKNVCFVYHAVEDLTLAQQLKRAFYPQDERVQIIEEELNCIEFGNIVRQFDFVIASRYHSIVHSYKKAVPAVVFGWAIKYQELMAHFEQTRFFFDVRQGMEKQMVVQAVEDMCNGYSWESFKIANCLSNLEKENVYDYIIF